MFQEDFVLLYVQVPRPWKSLRGFPLQEETQQLGGSPEAKPQVLPLGESKLTELQLQEGLQAEQPKPR